MILLQHLPEDSAFKVAHSDGDWPLQAQLATGAWNEIKAMRGDLWAFLGHEKLAFKPILTPSAERDQKARRAQMRAMHDEMIAQMRG